MVSCYVGMSTVAGTHHHSFWSMRDIKIFSGCFLLFQHTCLVPGLN